MCVPRARMCMDECVCVCAQCIHAECSARGECAANRARYSHLNNYIRTALVRACARRIQIVCDVCVRVCVCVCVCNNNLL